MTNSRRYFVRFAAVGAAVPAILFGAGTTPAAADDMPTPAPGPGPGLGAPEWYPPLLLPPETAAANQIPFQLFDPAPEDVVIIQPPLEQVPVVDDPRPIREPFGITVLDENGNPMSPEQYREWLKRQPPPEIPAGGYDVSGSPG